MTEIACVVALEARLGEGPFWQAADKKLYWFDIKSAKLFALKPKDGQVRSWSLASRASAGAAIEGDDGLLISAEDGLWCFEPETSSRSQAEATPRVTTTGFRSNDGKTDPHGALWWSSMDDDGGKRPGAIYRFDGHESHKMFDEISIANALSFAADGRTGYFADSPKKTIWRFSYDAAANKVGEREVFATIENGEPDGSALDAEGCLWVAIWGGSRVDRFSPDGKVVQSLPMPVSQPSCAAFGGEDLATLYITSAWEGLSETDRAAQPLAGGLFAAKPGVRGLAIPPVRVDRSTAPPADLSPSKAPA